MTAFEDFVNLELPRRGVTFTPSSVGGYDGDPNDAIAPDVLKYSPIGTTYYETSARRYWRKMSAASDDWQISVNSGTIDLFTTADIDLYVDNINGDDTNDGSIGNPIKTLIEAESRLPFIVNHRIIIHVLPYDSSIPNAGTYTWPTFRPRIHLVDSPIIVISEYFEEVATGSAQAGTTQSLIVTTGGLTVDEYVSTPSFIQITSGNAEGDIKTISENSATDIEPSFSFTGVVVAGDTYRILRPVVRFSVPVLDGSRCVLAIGTQHGIHQSRGHQDGGIYIINCYLEPATNNLFSIDYPLTMYGVIGSPPSTLFLFSNSSIKSGEEEYNSTWPYQRCTLMNALFPVFCPTDSSFSGWGLSSTKSIYLNSEGSGFNGFVVSTSYIGSRTYGSIVVLHGGRARGIICGSNQMGVSGRFDILASESTGVPHVDFKIRQTVNAPAINNTYSIVKIHHTDIKQTGDTSGSCIRSYGIGARTLVYQSTGVSNNGYGLVADDNGKIEVLYTSCSFSGGAGDFTADNGVTTHNWSELIDGSTFTDLVVDPVTHAVTGTGTLIMGTT